MRGELNGVASSAPWHSCEGRAGAHHGEEADVRHRGMVTHGMGLRDMEHRSGGEQC